MREDYKQIEGLWGIWSGYAGEKVYSHTCNNGNFDVDEEYRCLSCQEKAPQYVVDVWTLLSIISGNKLEREK